MMTTSEKFLGQDRVNGGTLIYVGLNDGTIRLDVTFHNFVMDASGTREWFSEQSFNTEATTLEEAQRIAIATYCPSWVFDSFPGVEGFWPGTNEAHRLEEEAQAEADFQRGWDSYEDGAAFGYWPGEDARPRFAEYDSTLTA